MAVLSLLAIPSAAIAGGTTCVGTMMLVPWSFIAIAVGWIAIVAVMLVATHFHRPIQQSWRLIARAILALAVASTAAIPIGFGLYFVAYYFGAKSNGDDVAASSLAIAAISIPFIIWSVACWISLHGWEFWKGNELDEGK